MSDIVNAKIIARQRFEQARRQATRAQVSARLTGEDIKLLPFDAIRAELQQQNPYYHGICEVPLDAIVGSVGAVQSVYPQIFTPYK